MKIMLISSTAFYSSLEEYAARLRPHHDVLFPVGYHKPCDDSLDGSALSAEMLRKSAALMPSLDAVLVINLDKYHRFKPASPSITNEWVALTHKNYIGGAVFLEIYEAWKNRKLIYVLNPIPENSFTEELIAFSTIVLNGDLSKIG